MKRFKALLLILFSLALFLGAALTLYTMLRSLAVRDTLSAVESAFGSGVIGIFMVVLALRLFRKGRLMWRDAR